MKTYSQNQEDLFVLNYFKGFKGTLLEIGANDGQTLSNSLLLIENGWKAHLVEPGRKVFDELWNLHRFNRCVKLHNYGIGHYSETVKFYESGAHVLGGNDNGLVSTINYSETERWRANGVEFKESEIELKTFSDFFGSCCSEIFDFISIDAEGLDWDILQQINLTDVGCKALCIEWNGLEALQVHFMDYCALHGLKLAHKNAENLIFVK